MKNQNQKTRDEVAEAIADLTDEMKIIKKWHHRRMISNDHFADIQDEIKMQILALCEIPVCKPGSEIFTYLK